MSRAHFTVPPVGARFSWTWDGQTTTFERLPDASAPMFECERIQVRVLACSIDPKRKPSAFGVDPEWFWQRIKRGGFVVLP